MLRSTTAIAALVVFIAGPALAQDIDYDGENVDINRDVETVDGKTTGNLDVQFESGEGLTRTFEREGDSETKSASRSAETVTNSGQSVSTGDAVSCDGAGTCTRTRGATGPDGQSLGYDRSVTATEGNASSTTTKTGPDGESVTKERALKRTETGVERSSGVTGPENSASVEGGFGYTEENGFQRWSSATGPQGNSSATDGNIQCANGTCERSASQTGPGGEGRSVENRTTLGEFGVLENQRNVTAPNGETRRQTRFGRVGRPRRR